MISNLRRPGIFPRREFQRRVVQHLRAAPAPPVALSQEVLARLAADSGVAVAWSHHGLEMVGAVAELIEQRIILCPEDWVIGKPCRVNPEAIVGESAEERLARLPRLAEVPAWMAASGNVLLGFGALLFFIFYCTYLPQSWIGPVTGTATFIGALLGYAGLKLNDTRAVSASHWTLRKWLAVAGVNLFLATVNLIGYFHPCLVEAPPGAMIAVDGKVVWTAPPIDSDEPLDWLRNQKHPLHLRWDTHDIRVSKKWHVTGDWHAASSGTVTLDWLQPTKLFAHWKMQAQLVPLLRIVSGRVIPDEGGTAIQTQSPTALAEQTGGAPEPLRILVAAWDAGLQAALTDGSGTLAEFQLKPLVLRVEARIKPDKSGSLAFAIFDLKGEMLHPFLPIQLRDISEREELEEAGRIIFGQLESELQIRKLRDPRQLAKAGAATAAIQQATASLDSQEIEKSIDSTEAALVPLGEHIARRHVSPQQSAAVSQSLWNSAAVATEAIRVGKSERAAAVAEGISKIGETAAQAGNLFLAKTANDSLQQIVEAPTAHPPQTTSPIAASQERVALAIESVQAQDTPRSPRVYLQIAGETQRAKAQQIASMLKGAGYIIPGIQNVLGRAYVPPQTEVRYFADTAQTQADQIVSKLKAAGGQGVRAAHLKPSARDLAISSDIASHFEVWFSREWP